MNQDIQNIVKKQSHLSKFWLYYMFILIEAIMILLYGLFTTFGKETNPKSIKEEDAHTQFIISKYYSFFQDVHVMIFVGFGFLMTFLKKYSWSAVSKNFLIAAWTIQLSLLVNGFWKAVLSDDWSKKIELDLHKLIDADFAAGSILIAFGAVLGKLHFTQYLVMATIQTIIYGLQMNICFNSFIANDLGGSISIHLFGAYFGLTVALVMKRKDVEKHPLNASNYISNITAMIGTLFLWMYWPSFNAAMSSGNAQHRAIITTLISITGSCVMVFLLTPFFKEGKFHMEFILNATLAGGVTIGSVADIIIHPWVAFFIGCCAGTLSLIGYEIIGPYLNKKIGLQDTCGVHSLHGMPGLLGGLLSSIIAGTATQENYGDSLIVLFPMLENNNRTNGIQACYQLATIAVSLGFAIVGGIITGYVLKAPLFEQINSLFDDSIKWVYEEEDQEHDVLVSDSKSRAMNKLNSNYLCSEMATVPNINIISTE
jgi:ammonium transporter Rh